MNENLLRKLYEKGYSTREIAEKVIKHKNNPYGSVDSARANILRAVRVHHVPDKLASILKDIGAPKRKIRDEIQFIPRTTASKAFIEGKKKPKKSKPVKPKKSKPVKPKPKKKRREGGALPPKPPKKKRREGGATPPSRKPYFWDRVDMAILGCRCEGESPQIIGVVGGSNETQIQSTEIVHEFIQVFDNRVFTPSKKYPKQTWSNKHTIRRPLFRNLLIKLIERHDAIYKAHTLIDVFKLAVFNSSNSKEYTRLDPSWFEGY